MGGKTWSERSIESIFIGNIENSVQGKYRSNPDWAKYISSWHCTKGTTPKFTQQEYLDNIASARFGLSLRGFGAKCHGEIELMAVGTVPIVTPEVCLDAYMEPLLDGVHCIKVNKPEDIPVVLSEINENKWKQMSAACKDWYMRNVHSSNMWRTFMERFMKINPQSIV